MFRGYLKIRYLLQCMVLFKFLLQLICIDPVASESPILPKITFDLTLPLNRVLSGDISKSDFKKTLFSNYFFKNDVDSGETVTFLYAAGMSP